MRRYSGNLLISCYSDKEVQNIYFEIEPDSSIWTLEEIDMNFIDEGCADYYWENHFEFEPALTRLKEMVAEDRNLNYHDAIGEVFGHFHLRYAVNGTIEDIKLDVDIEKIMYDLLLSDPDLYL